MLKFEQILSFELILVANSAVYYETLDMFE